MLPSSFLQSKFFGNPAFNLCFVIEKKEKKKEEKKKTTKERKKEKKKHMYNTIQYAYLGTIQ